MVVEEAAEEAGEAAEEAEEAGEAVEAAEVEAGAAAAAVVPPSEVLVKRGSQMMPNSSHRSPRISLPTAPGRIRAA